MQLFRSKCSPFKNTFKWVAIAAVTLVTSAYAQVTVVPTTPQVGSSNPATAEPLVPRPTTTPCTVQLFQNMKFADFSPKSFTYTPPVNCPGPWSKVVFTAEFTVTAGRQYDRTAAFYLGHANIYYGTTAEPRKTLSPSWHVERDVTDLSAIFNSAQTGQADLGNFVGVYGGVTYDGVIYANAALQFYPANSANPAPRVPDMVIPLNGGGGDAGTLNTGSDSIAPTLNLPQNIERAYVDVIAQSQSNDEFWYTCVPNDETGPLQSCGGTAFRETELAVDGQPAGVAPVYPWIYTGGIDPYLWEPIPGIQTLDFVPYRIDLTPFAGVLSDGNPHAVGISVYSANHYFLATANLLIYTDHGSSTVTGGLVSDTLSQPSPMVQDNVTSPSSGVYTGTVDTTAGRSFTISGYVNTSHGRVDTTVRQSVSFTNDQSFTIDDTQYLQNIEQMTSLDSSTMTRAGAFTATYEQHFRYPLTLGYSFVANSDGTYAQQTTVGQGYQNTNSSSMSGVRAYTSSIREADQATDTLHWDANFNFLGPTNGTASQNYLSRDSRGQCYSRAITAAAQVLTSVNDGQGCGK